jgi:hypothetical protein
MATQRFTSPFAGMTTVVWDDDRKIDDGTCKSFSSDVPAFARTTASMPRTFSLSRTALLLT